MKRHALSAALAAGIALSYAPIAPVYAQSAAEQSKPRSEPIYGYRTMSDAERNEYREKMRNARTTAERQTLRDEHRKTMEARMKEQGVEPGRRRGGGGGPGGPGAGEGRGPGAGTGGGPGLGRGAGPDAQGYGKGPGGPGYGKGGVPRGEGPGYGKGPGAGPGSSVTP